MSNTRHEAHAYLDRLRGEQLSAVHDLLESMLSPLDRALALAPLDDEPLTPEEAASIEEASASLDRNGGVPMEEVLADFGLTREDLHSTKEK
jgi:hypothetical protein